MIVAAAAVIVIVIVIAAAVIVIVIVAAAIVAAAAVIVAALGWFWSSGPIECWKCRWDRACRGAWTRIFEAPMNWIPCCARRSNRGG